MEEQDKIDEKHLKDLADFKSRIIEEERKKARYKKIMVVAVILLILSAFSIVFNLLEMIR